MKKKFLALLLAGVMALTLIACGGGQSAPSGDADAESAANADAESDADANADAESADADATDAANETPDSAATPYKIALCMSHQTNAFTIAVGAGAKAKAEELGVTVDIFDGKQDQATQASQVEQCVNSGYDGILVEPVSVDGIVPAVKAANEEGVPVITVVQQMSGQSEYAKAYRGGNDANAGQLQMEKVAELLGGKGNIAILYGPMGSDGQIIRKEGYDKTLANYPDIHVEFAETANWVTEEALSLVENWLSTGTEINAIVAQNDGMAMGALKAVEDAGLKDSVIVVGVDAVDDALSAINEGRLDGTISQDAAGQGALGVQAMVDYLNGEEIEPVEYTECIWVTKDNVADYLS